LQPEPEGIGLQFEAARLLPPPTGRADSRPPIWFWDYVPPAVRLSVPVTVGSDVPPGEYELGYELWAGTDYRTESTSETVTLTVTRE
jgi:hypothetical protein